MSTIVGGFGPDIQSKTVFALRIIKLVDKIGVDGSILGCCVGIGKVTGLCLGTVEALGNNRSMCQLY